MSKWEVGNAAIPYQDGRWVWMRPQDHIPLNLGAFGWVRLTAAEARDLATRLLKAAEQVEPGPVMDRMVVFDALLAWGMTGGQARALLLRLIPWAYALESEPFAGPPEKDQPTEAGA